jgi:hypothetical protein
MRPRVLAVLALAALLLVVPTAAQAKGAAEATIDGGGPGCSTVPKRAKRYPSKPGLGSADSR